MEKIIESLSPLERKIIPYLGEKLEDLVKKSGLDKISVLRALKFLENKQIIKITSTKSKTIQLGTNGIYYLKQGLPERKLLVAIENNNLKPLGEIAKKAHLSDNEFKVALGVLKKKAYIEITNGSIALNAKKEEISKKFLEENFLEELPLVESKLTSEQRYALSALSSRKEIIEIIEEEHISYDITPHGKTVLVEAQKMQHDLIEEVTPEVIRNPLKGKKFRRYDIEAHVPQITGGKRHFVNQSIEFAKTIWLDLGFTEMKGSIADSSFWVFDALFTPQDHPIREMQDSFFIKSVSADLPEKHLVDRVKEAHTKGISGSIGWGEEWKEDEAKKVVLRTHTTSLSAQTLATLKESDLPAKYFSIGKVFRNETLDWSHNIEFYQTEGIVVDTQVTFSNLLGYLQEFYKRMGFEKIRFRPSYFPYTEPSVEIEVFHPERKKWIELGGAGIFRPEVVVPLLGKNIRVLAWGQGLDRIIMDFYQIKDLREMYSNDLKKIREKRIWTKT
jgi:phenylalanyl-tRNA synthetase alpha chain